jgi:hypothetical protein
MQASINDKEVEVLDRDQQKVDASFDRMKFKMSTDEFAKWARVFPDPLPATHKLVYSWSLNSGTRQMELVLECVAIVASDPDDVGPVQQAANDHAEKALATEQARKALDALADPELHTRAAELGVKTKGKGRAVIIADMLAAKK